MMQAKHSIDIVGWELSLSFGLVYVSNTVRSEAFKSGNAGSNSTNAGIGLNLLQLANFKTIHNNKNNNNNAQDSWISLEQVLLAKAASGVKIRIMIWRHHIMSYLNRFLYLGEVTIEREVYVSDECLRALLHSCLHTKL